MAINLADARVRITTDVTGQEEIDRLRTQIDRLKQNVANYNGVQAAGVQHDRQRQASMAMAGQQMQDFAMQVQMGTDIGRAFSMQAGQMAFALQGMGGALGKVGAFMSGPWGSILLIATTTLIAFKDEIFGTKKALEQLEGVSGGVGDAQATMGNMFDIASGKIKNNTAETKLNTLAKIENMRVTAQEKLNKGFETMNTSRGVSWGTTLLNVGQMMAEGIVNQGQVFQAGRIDTSKNIVTADPGIRNALAGIRDFKSGLDVYQRIQKGEFNFEGNAVGKQQALQAALDIASGFEGLSAADKAQTSLLSGNLDKQFRSTSTGGGRSRTGGAANTLANLLESVIREFDPISAAGAEYVQNKQNISKLRSANMIDASTGDQYLQSAGSKYLDTVRKLGKPPAILDPDQQEPIIVNLGRIDEEIGNISGKIESPAKRGMQSAIENYTTSISDTAKAFENAWSTAFKGTEDALTNFVMTGKLSFKDLANSIIADLVRVAIQQAIMKPLTSWLGGLFGFGNGAAFSNGNVVANAYGNAFTGGNVIPFAGGGVVSSPMLFPMSRGRTGLMGEAGPEAIVPLRRMGNGRLGVETTGGGSQNVVVNVNVDGGGSQVQADGAQAAQLGSVIANVVRAELVNQKRPGGLLAAA